MTLFSNSSMDYHPDNKTSTFTVQLPRNIQLNGEWKVSLFEIQYPYSFFTVQEGQNEMMLQLFTASSEFIASKGKTKPPTTSVSVKITPGFYMSVKDLIYGVNKVVKKDTKLDNFFHYDAISQRVSIKKGIDIVEGSKVVVSFKPSVRLALQLGYRPDEEIQVEGSYAPHVANTSSGIADVMLVYCDIIEPQITGDSWAKVLRTLKTTPDGAVPYFALPCSMDFTQLQYVPIQKKYFESISIDIRDTAGKLMPFQYGTLSVKLHFKRISQ